jgi:DNA-binding CsgD family transcriptional regulator
LRDYINVEMLVDEIYEAGVVPERWPQVFDKLAGIADGEGAMIFAAAPGMPRWCSSAAIHERVDRWTRSPFSQNNPRSERLFSNIETRFLTDLDRFTLEELDKEKFYTEVLRPDGLGWCVGTSIGVPSSDMLVLSVEKAYAKGPVPRETAEQLDRLRPHLARSAILAGRLGVDRARTAIATLEMIELPAAAVTRNGRVVAANSAFQSVSATVGIGARDHVQFSAPAIQTMFVEALDRPVSLARTGRSIPIAATSASAPLIVHVLPLRLAGLDVFTGAVSIVFVVAINQQGSPPPELLQTLFDLTPAEARIASMLIDGHSLTKVSKLQGVSLNTVRTQLKSVFAKTGVDRQVDLARLLGQRRVRVV